MSDAYNSSSKEERKADGAAAAAAAKQAALSDEELARMRRQIEDEVRAQVRSNERLIAGVTIGSLY